MYIRTIPLDLWTVRCRMANLKFSHENIGTVGCLQTNAALPQLCNISWVSPEISWLKAQCIFALLYTAKNIISQHRQILQLKPCVCLAS